MPDREPREPKAPKPTSAREWAKADTIEPEELVVVAPQSISDGGGLPFALDALARPFGPLDPREGPVRALLDQIDASNGKTIVRLPWKDDHADLEEAAQKLIGWRVLSSADDEVVYGRGVPPTLVTVAVKRQRKELWGVKSVNVARSLRAVREGVRASSFRVDPDQPPQPDDDVLRLLVTEQTYAGGRLAYGRFMTPELYIDEGRLLLRIYIRPRPGFQSRTRRWETPVLLRLPQPLGTREVIDGAVYFEPPPKSRDPRDRKSSDD